jgi:hypothetical protein
MQELQNVVISISREEYVSIAIVIDTVSLLWIADKAAAIFLI